MVCLFSLFSLSLSLSLFSLLTKKNKTIRHEGYTIDGKPWLEKLKHEDYAAEIVEFKRILSRIGKKHGWTLGDIQKRFSNELFDGLIYDL